MPNAAASGGIETLITSLAECDLIVDATADARAFGYLCAAASAGGKPVVWAEVFGGGFGGLIARHRPLLDPDPASMRRIIENWCVAQGTPPVSRAHNYETVGSGPPLIADDTDVAVIGACGSLDVNSRGSHCNACAERSRRFGSRPRGIQSNTPCTGQEGEFGTRVIAAISPF